MWQKNNGKSETEIVQNRFTAYLATAVKRRRNDYLQQQDRRQQIESLTEDYPFLLEYSIEQDTFTGKEQNRANVVPMMCQFEDANDCCRCCQQESKL